LPAGLPADGADDGEVVGGDGALAVVVLVVGGAAVVGDEAVLDEPLHGIGHVAVEAGLHADGHGDGLVVAEQVARTVGSLLVMGADAGGEVPVRGYVLADFPSQAMLAAGAVGSEAAEVAIGLLAEQGFFVLHTSFLGLMLQR